MPIINGLKIPLKEKMTVKDVIEKFFDFKCEILVSRNSKPIQSNRYHICKVKENDILQVITYSKNCNKIHKRTIFKEANE